MGRGLASRLSGQLFVFDLLVTPVVLLVAGYLRSRLAFGQGGALPEEAVRLPWFVYLLAVGSWILALLLADVYQPERVLRWYHETGRVILAAALATALIAGAAYFTYREMSRLQFVYFVVLNTFVLLSGRALFRLYYRARGRRRPGWRSRVLILGAGELGGRLAHTLIDHSRWGLDLVGFLDDKAEKKGARLEGAPVLGGIEDLERVVKEKRVEEVWLALPARAHARITEVVMAAERLPVRVKIAPDYFSLALVRARPEILGGIPLIGLREPVIEGWTRLAKRAFDLLVGAALVFLLSPLLGLVALAIRLGGPGPIWIRQTRAGENGRPFGMYKFRSMIPQAEGQARPVGVTQEDGSLLHKAKDDPRVTRVGRILRRYSLDELPQLFNVLKGEMSLVGPRPELPWLVDRYEPWQRKRFAVPQGLTGWWQINGRSEKPMHLNTEADLYYVYNYSLWLDMLILLRTPFVVLAGEGAF